MHLWHGFRNLLRDIQRRCFRGFEFHGGMQLLKLRILRFKENLQDRDFDYCFVNTGNSG